jgi:hypothetical protein
MNSRPVPITPWMNRRARILHGICRVIAKDRAGGMRAGAAYAKGRGRWNRSVLARQRGRRLCESGMRAIYATWLKNPTSSAFAPKWKSPSRKKITPGQAVKWTRRVIAQRLTFAELFRRLKRENSKLDFCPATLNNALPSSALRVVRRAHLNLLRAERAALAVLDARAKGSAS